MGEMRLRTGRRYGAEIKALILVLALSGCANMPRGQHGEVLAIRHGWLQVAQVSDKCLYEQRATAFRVRCIL